PRPRSRAEAGERHLHALLECRVGNALATLGGSACVGGADPQCLQPWNDLPSALFGQRLRLFLCRRFFPCRRRCPGGLALLLHEVLPEGTLGAILIVGPAA